MTGPKPRSSWPKADWVVMLDGGAFKCLRCGDYYGIPLPANMDVYLAAAKAYCRVHKSCRVRPPDPARYPEPPP